METCYRHPDRQTGVSCSNCGRAICPDCMTSTSVGMRCPECSRERTRVTNPVGAPGGRDAPATYALIAICVAAFAAEVAGGANLLTGSPIGPVGREGGLFAFALDRGEPIGVAEGEPYRLLSAAFLHGGLLHLGLNMFALYFLGSLLEPAIGSARFVAIFLISALGGSFGALLLDPLQLTVGASGGIFGLMAAAFLSARGRGLDALASQIGFFVIANLVFTFSIPNISIGGHLGGLAAGGLAALLVLGLERRRVPNARLVEIGGLAALAIVATAAALAAAEAGVPAGLG